MIPPKINVGAPGSVARRVHDAIDTINRALPVPKDAGGYYANKAEKARLIRLLIASENDPSAVWILRRELELAELVGD